MKNHLRLWADFCSSMQVLPKEQDLTNTKFFTFTCDWLKHNNKRIGLATWNVYKLDSYLAYNPSEYALEHSSFNVRNTIERLAQFQPSSIDSMVMIISDILWDLVAFKSDTQCPNCSDDALRVLYDPEQKSVVLSCDSCSWSQMKNGTIWFGNYHLVPANIEELRAAGYLNDR